MKQVTIITDKATIVFLDLPESASGIHVEDDLICFDFKEEGITYPDYKILHGQWKHIGHPSQLTEEDWKGIVEDANCGGFDIYYNYVDECWFDYSMGATESGLSLLKANGVVMENTIGEEPKCDCEFNCPGQVQEECHSNYLEWQQAQSKVWLNPQIFIKV